MGGFYTAPDYEIQRHIIDPKVTSAASATVQKYLLFAAARLKAVHWLPLTAGTDTAAGLDIYVGTNSVGALTFGTKTTQADSGLINAIVPDNAVLELKGKAGSATAVGSVNIEWEMLWNAQES